MQNDHHKIALGVNIDHIALLREARRINDPELLQAVGVVAQNGADQITIHLREDRRHIQDEDVRRIITSSPLPINLECSIDPQMVEIALQMQPHRVTLVPEKREEVTTEGGLDVINSSALVSDAIEQLKSNHIEVSLFIDPDEHQVEHSCALEAQMIELHTGRYANIYAMLNSALAYSHHSIDELDLPRDELQVALKESLDDLTRSAKHASLLGLRVAAGHGLNYHNVSAMCAIDDIFELNIGQSIIARSIYTGLATAVEDMRKLVVR